MRILQNIAQYTALGMVRVKGECRPEATTPKNPKTFEFGTPPWEFSQGGVLNSKVFRFAKTCFFGYTLPKNRDRVGHGDAVHGGAVPHLDSTKPPKLKITFCHNNNVR